MADSFILTLAGNLAENAEEAGLEKAMDAYYEKHPDKWNAGITIAMAFAGWIAELEGETNSKFLKKLEEGLVIAVNDEATKHPVS